MQNGKLVLYRLKRFFGIAAAIAAFGAIVYNAADDLRLLRLTDGDYGGIMLAAKNDAEVPALVNINTASVHSLQRIEGIGLAAANAIVEYRAKNGGFKTVDELERVSGIGAKTLEKIRGRVTI